MTEMMNHIYTTREGWISTGEYRLRLNPNRAWYNALWQPAGIIQQKLYKVVCGETYKKWVSVTGSFLIEDAEDDA